MIVALALATGIAPAVWAAEPDDVIMTALDLLDERRKRSR